MNGMFLHIPSKVGSFFVCFSFLEEGSVFLRWKKPEFWSYFAPIFPFRHSLGLSPAQVGRQESASSGRRLNSINLLLKTTQVDYCRYITKYHHDCTTAACYEIFSKTFYCIRVQQNQLQQTMPSRESWNLLLLTWYFVQMPLLSRKLKWLNIFKLIFGQPNYWFQNCIN